MISKKMSFIVKLKYYIIRKFIEKNKNNIKGIDKLFSRNKAFNLSIEKKKEKKKVDKTLP